LKVAFKIEYFFKLILRGNLTASALARNISCHVSCYFLMLFLGFPTIAGISQAYKTVFYC